MIDGQANALPWPPLVTSMVFTMKSEETCFKDLLLPSVEASDVAGLRMSNHTKYTISV